MTHTTKNDLLFESDVLVVGEDGVSLTDPFENAVDDYETRFAEAPREELARAVDARIDERPVADAFIELGLIDPRTVAELCALSDRLEASTGHEWLSVLPVLRLFRPDGVRADGAPDQAIPVPAAHLPFLTTIYSPALAYVWLDDCPPCDSLKTRLESTFEQHEGISLFAVYGPDDREYLVREYSVTAGPALLFMREGSIDARLYGDQSERVLELELERLSGPPHTSVR